MKHKMKQFRDLHRKKKREKIMKKKLLNLVLCLIGFGMGFLSLLYATTPILELENYAQKIVKSGIKEKETGYLAQLEI